MRLQPISLNIRNGEKVRLVSRRGSIITTAKVTEIVDENVVFMPSIILKGQLTI